MGQLDNGNNTDSNVPVAVDTSGVLNGKTLTQINSGSSVTCALDTDGKAYCWGHNIFGTLGNGTTNDSNVPVAVNTGGVLNGKTLVQISSYGVHVCALDVEGKAYCWGLNNKRQLGNGNNTNSNVPVAVNLGGILAGKTIKEICAFDQSTCVLDVDGQVYCWGGGTNGELGHGSTADSATPVVVKAPATNVYLDNKSCIQISVNSDGTALTCRVPAGNSYGTVAVSLNHSACSLSLPNVYTYRLKCDVANCTTCSSDDVCQNCDSGYYLDNNQCQACTLPNCNTCSNATTCTTCATGYHLDSNNQCVMDCNISNCTTCSAPDICGSCDNGYYLDNNQCHACTLPNCNDCSNATTCTSCATGYHLNSSNQCEMDCNITNCTTCSAPDVCGSCEYGYYLDGNECKTCTSISNCLSCSNAYTCTTCKPGYHLNSSNQCDPDCSIANCTNCPAPNQCNSCAPGFYLDGNECKACTLPNCDACSNATTCTSCATGYHLNASNQCEMDCNINNCNQCSAPDVCGSCQHGYYLDGNQCLSCSSLPNCTACDNATTCTSCATGYHLNSANQCELDCNISNCTTCSAPDVCLTCQPGYQLNSSNQCIDSSLPFYDFSLTKVVNPSATQAHNLFSFVLEKLTLNASNQEIVDGSFPAQTINLADNQTHLFTNLPKGKYRLTEYLFPYWSITAADNLEQDSNYQPHDLVATYYFSLNSLNPHINQATLTATISHAFSGLSAINLQISGGAQSWFNALRSSEIKATANQLTNLPLAKVSYQLNTPYLSAANTTPLGNICGSGTLLPIDAINPYLGGGVVDNLPSPTEGKHTLYACAAIKHATTNSSDNGEVVIAKADFWYDATPLSCSFNATPIAGAQPNTAIFTASCIDPGYPDTGSGPCPTQAPSNPADACRDDYLNNYSCQTNDTPGSTCSISVRDYAGNITNLTSPGNPFGQPVPTPTPAPTPTPTPGSPSSPTPTSGCTAPTPGSLAPFIYKVERLGASKIKLFFTPGSQPFTHYQLSYGYAGQDFAFGTKVSDPTKGEVEVDYLSANASYNFQLLPVNDCATGTWSNLFPVTLTPQADVVLTKAQLTSQLDSGSLTPSTPPTTPAPAPTITPTPNLL